MNNSEKNRENNSGILNAKYKEGQELYVFTRKACMPFKDWINSREYRMNFTMDIRKVVVKEVDDLEEGDPKYIVTRRLMNGDTVEDSYYEFELMDRDELETKVIDMTLGRQVFNHKYEKASSSLDVAEALRENAAWRRALDNYFDRVLEYEQETFETWIPKHVNWSAVFANNDKFDQYNHVKEGLTEADWKEVAKGYADYFDWIMKEDGRKLELTSLSVAAYGRAKTIESFCDEQDFSDFMSSVVDGIREYVDRLQQEFAAYLEGKSARKLPLMKEVFELAYDNNDMRMDDVARLDDGRWYVNVDRLYALEETNKK